MEDIDRATKAQEWLMEYYRQWVPLDSCLALVRHIEAVPAALPPDAVALIHEAQKQLQYFREHNFFDLTKAILDLTPATLALVDAASDAQQVTK